ncbi:MAG: aromatic-ring-hydroxylating dioxygenase subunit beta [Alphaproteobacteria bacterium]|nr:aromatic-ring-hydroxylating dioxygenase subunit beta [Alphaproteobacteria bacterium]
MTQAAPGSAGDRFALYDLFVTYGALIDAMELDAWLALFAASCTYHIVPRENYERGLPAGLVYCDSRAMLEDRIRALREANKYNIHNDRHLIGLPRVIGEERDAKLVEAPFAVYQTDQEGETRLFATGLYRDRIVAEGNGLKFRDKLVLLDSFAVPSLLATPL